MVGSDVVSRYGICPEHEGHFRPIRRVPRQQCPFLLTERTGFGKHFLWNEELSEVMTQPGDTEPFESAFVESEGLAQANRQLTHVQRMRSQVVPLGSPEMLASLRQDVPEALVYGLPGRGSDSMCRLVE
jgi:hypothetical protein